MFVTGSSCTGKGPSVSTNKVAPPTVPKLPPLVQLNAKEGENNLLTIRLI